MMCETTKATALKRKPERGKKGKETKKKKELPRKRHPNLSQTQQLVVKYI